MNCAKRTGVYALLVSVFAISQSVATYAKDGKDHSIVVNSNIAVSSMPMNSALPEEFRWNEHRKLNWEDFRGPVKANNEESAAATHCGIGFKTIGAADGKLQVVVYNTFYANRSWVRADAKIPEILSHEQGHFDLCELYTRKLRERMAGFNFGVADVRGALMNIYTQVQNEYEVRQQAYEAETTHGTNLAVQKRWQDAIGRELMTAGNAVASNN